MKTIKVEINDKEYEILVAQSEEEKERGLMDVIELEPSEGMLFVYDEPQELSFWMHDTSIELKIIFIDEDWEVKKIELGKPFDETPITCDDVQYVLELHPDAEVNVGDEVDIEDDELEPGRNLQSKYMDIYGPDGKVQAQIVGGERILSISDTRTLVKMARKAYTTKKESDYKRLGKKIFEYLHTQDTNQPEYVEQKTKKES